MFARNITGSQSGAKLPAPLFNINHEDEDLEEIDRVARKSLQEDDSGSSSNTPPRVTRDHNRDVRTRSRFFASSSDAGEAEDSNLTHSSNGCITDGSDRDDLFRTPQEFRTLTSETTPDTPEAIDGFKTVLNKNDLGYDLTPTSGATFGRVMKKVNRLISPDEAKGAARALFRDKLLENGSTEEIPSLVPGRLVFSSTNRDDISCDWTTQAAQALNIRILDAAHLNDIEEGQKGGFHVCGRGHPQDAYVRLRRTNLLTGVWCGVVYDNKDPAKIVKKFSSFIPREMKFRDYKLLVAKALNSDDCRIAQENNRRLYRVGDEDNSFVIECYFQEKGTVIASAFPVFHYEVYTGESTSFKVPYSFKWSLADNDPIVPCTYEVIYEQLFELLANCQEAIVYNMEDKIIVDLGKLYSSNTKYGRCPIEDGLLVEIPKKFLEEGENYGLFRRKNT
jgi:hypothetical protein